MLKAGVALADISPKKGLKLAGYPHCHRPNEGTHDPLYAGVLYLESNGKKLVWITLDLLYFGKPYTRELRSRFPDMQIMVTTSHTHSGPHASTPEAIDHDEGIEVDTEYITNLIDTLEAKIKEAVENSFDAKLGTAVGKCGAEQGVGGNRRHPEDVADPSVNVLAVKDMDDKVRGILFSYALHPTYLHAENMLATADYPAYIRRYLNYAAPGAVFMFAQGTSGNQSSRYFRTEQSFEEACRVGTTLGVAIFHLLETMEYSSDVELKWATKEVELPMRTYPPLDVAEKERAEARRIFAEMDDSNYIRKRNAELTMFGAENIYAYAKYVDAHGSINMDELPCEIGVTTIGDTMIFNLQGEIFVEFGLALKEASPCKKAFVFEVSNGSLPGYIYTRESVAEGGYEVGTSVFDADAGYVLVDEFKSLMSEVK